MRVRPSRASRRRDVLFALSVLSPPPYDGSVLTTPARAKINLLLNVLARRPDGYHDLEMVNLSLDLHDTVSLEPAASFSAAVTAEADATGAGALPCDGRNIAVRALQEVCRLREIAPAYRLTIRKRIPVGAGLAGGSTDAAAVLRLLGAEHPDLAALALKLGADVPYCLSGEPAVVRGIGETIEPFALGRLPHFVVANPGFEVPTKSVFEAWRAAPRTAPPSDPGRLAAALARGDWSEAGPLASNDLQPVTCRLHEGVARLIEAVRGTGPALAMMSGSGPTVIGMFPNRAEAEAAARRLVAAAPFVRVASAARSARETPPENP